MQYFWFAPEKKKSQEKSVVMIKLLLQITFNNIRK